MMTLLALMSAALIIGYYVGRSPAWAIWHGPVGAVIVVPIALWLRFQTVIAVLAPLCLAVGFVIAKWPEVRA